MYSMDIVWRLIVNVCIKCISATVLILHASVIDKQSNIENIGSSLWPLHSSLLSLHLGQILQELCEMTYSSYTNGAKAFRLYGVLRGRFTSHMFFLLLLSSTVKISRKRESSPKGAALWMGLTSINNNNMAFVSGKNKYMFFWGGVSAGAGLRLSQRAFWSRLYYIWLDDAHTAHAEQKSESL